jgi:hypothetical protein
LNSFKLTNKHPMIIDKWQLLSNKRSVQSFKHKPNAVIQSNNLKDFA